ncbi:hypothetical protein [Aurantiacibacter rhizosphaerae]|uniref:Uncharacterized protein n=1 Tax=Aurantiacibacter rhizosphaerae TaxID=2691582 RepID=A0A844XBD8_9SPHN|nr:hypothetical protein [Aurantiacibacter rhizosphaerae]MWV26938.1 hypothetical protein [Aurantiacibacter rhizosphaerae]
MTEIEQQKRIANYLAAFAHLLCGAPGRFTEFRDKVDIMLSGTAPNAFGLMQFASRPQATRRPLLWVYQSAECPTVPQIGLVAQMGGGMHYIENCMLCLTGEDDRATLVPDGFNLGAYRFDDMLDLHHITQASASTFEAADGDMVSAYNRLIAIQADQWERGEVFDLPDLAQAA